MESMISMNGNINPKVDKVESTILDIRNLLSMIDRTKKNLNMSRWIHMPRDSEEYQFYNLLCGEVWGVCIRKIGTVIDGQRFEHLKKARAIYNLVGLKDLHSWSHWKGWKCSKGNTISGILHVWGRNKYLHDEYENNLNSLGINSEATILAGWNYAHLLYNANYLISAERLITKLVTISHRVNGSDHKTTMRANKLLGHCAVWCVVLLL